jgi:hypothetical protein
MQGVWFISYQAETYSCQKVYRNGMLKSEIEISQFFYFYMKEICESEVLLLFIFDSYPICLIYTIIFDSYPICLIKITPN